MSKSIDSTDYIKRGEVLLAQVVESVIKDSDLKDQFTSLQARCSAEFDKLDNKFLVPILRKLFKIIPSKSVGGLGDLIFPKESAKLSVLEILLLELSGISIYHKSKNVKFEIKKRAQEKTNIRYLSGSLNSLGNMFKGFTKKQQQIEEFKDMKEYLDKMLLKVMNEYEILVTVNQNGAEQTYILPPTKRDGQKAVVCINYKPFNYDLKNLKKSLNEIYGAITQEEWLEKTQELKDQISLQIKENLKRKYNLYPNMNIMERSFSSKQQRIQPISLFDQPVYLYGKPSLSDQSLDVLQLQKDGLVPSIFNPESLEKLVNKQIIIMLLDTSSSTSEREAYKVLDVSSAKVKDVLHSKLGEKVEIVILPFANTVNGIMFDLKNFIYPDGGTSTDLALKIGIEYLIQHKLNIFDSEKFKEFIEKITLLDSLDSDDGLIEGLAKLSDSNDISPADLQEALSGTKTKDKLGDFSYELPTNMEESSLRNYHIILLTDGLPNRLNKALDVATEVNRLGIGFSQVVTAYDFHNLASVVQSSILESLGGDEVHDMDEYQQGFEQLAQKAGGNTVTIWIDEKIAQAILSLTDLSIGLNFKKENGL